MTVPDDVRRRLMSQTSQLWGEPGVVDLGVGQPQDVLLPVEEFRRALSAAPVPPFQLQYGIERGDGALRVALADSLAPRYGAPVDPELMIISNGNSQAIDWCCAALTRPGDVASWSRTRPTSWLEERLADHGLRVVGLPMDDDGLLPDALAAALIEHRPAFVYTVPTYANPTGITTSATRRAEIVELIARHGSLLVADEVYHLLSYGEEPPPSCCAWLDSNVVICLGTFSKILAPGLDWAGFRPPGPDPGPARGVRDAGQRWRAQPVRHPHRDRDAAGRDRTDLPRPAAHDLCGTSRRDGRRAADRVRLTRSDRRHDHVGRPGLVARPDGGYFFWLRFRPRSTPGPYAPSPWRGARHSSRGRSSRRTADSATAWFFDFAYYGEDDLVRGVHALAEAFAARYPDLHLEDHR